MNVTNACVPAALAAIAATLLIAAAAVRSTVRAGASRLGGTEKAGVTAFLFRLFFKDADGETVCRKMGVDTKEHARYCALAGRDADFERMAVGHVTGLAAAIAGFAGTLLTASPVWICIGLPVFFLLYMGDRQTAKSAAQKKTAEMQDCVPRFLDLLQPQLETGIAPDMAVKMVCDRSDSLLTAEIRRAVTAADLGSADWPAALESVADRYGVDTLTTLMLAITSAYRKGVSVNEAVAREAAEIKREYILHKKENAQKAQNRIMLPITALQIAPLIAFFLIPSVVMLLGEWV